MFHPDKSRSRLREVLVELGDSNADVVKYTGRKSLHRIENRPMALVVLLESITLALLHQKRLALSSQAQSIP